MKVFVYSKSNGKKVAELKDVEMVAHQPEKHNIVFFMPGGVQVEFDTRIVKTTSYRN